MTNTNSNTELIRLKKRLLVHEAKRWLCFVEKGDNNGQMIEAFQRAVDNKAEGEPWCMSFVQYCVQQVDSIVDEIMQRTCTLRNGLESTEHCLTCWFKTPKSYQFQTPSPGRVVIWRHGESYNGHTGIVVQVEKDRKNMWVMEGNTGPANKEVQREGDGVYLKRRNVKGTGSMKVLGFLQPWLL